MLHLRQTSTGKIIMIRGWYHSRKNGQRLLSIDEIAEACCISVQEVRKWLADKIQKSEPPGRDLVDAADVVWFLVKNSIPVATSLLPPKTKKILLIASEEYEFQNKCERFDQICRFFSDSCNILVETSIAGRLADLSILTFSPNLVVIFLKTISRETINTFNFLTNFPEQKMLFIVDELIKDDVEHDLGKLSTHHLVVRDAGSIEQLFPQLRLFFHN